MADYDVLPASAGMIRTGCTGAMRTTCAPRIRGDDPIAQCGHSATLQCSPHPRG